MTALPATLAELAYSRDFEREADDYAAAMMRVNALSVSPMIELFEKMEKQVGGEGVSRYLSSHPHYRERIERLQSEGR